MCGIAGIITNKTSRAGEQLRVMLESMTHRGPDGVGYFLDGDIGRADTINDLDLTSKSGRIAIGHVRLAITGEASALQPFCSENGQITLFHNGEIYNHGRLRYDLSEDCNFQTNSDSEVIVRLVEKFYEGDLQAALEKTLPLLDGVYCLAVTDNKTTVIARDKIGVRQLYYANTPAGIAFSSERKPLLALSANGDFQIERLLPGHMARLDHEKVINTCFWMPELIRSTESISNAQQALSLYDEAIKSALRKRVIGRKRVGIIFSGGIDSFLIAYLVKQMGVPFTCYTAGRGKEAKDLKWAIELADRFAFPLKYRVLSKNDISELLPELIKDIEDHSFNQVEVAVPIYASVRMAQEAGERVILTGQGADELFGGYAWYPAVAQREGMASFEKRSFEDTFLLYKECLEREDKIAMAHSIELRVPFLDPKVIEMAFRIAPELKIVAGDDPLGKRIHRIYCQSIGIPEDIAFRKKEAAQHGANVHTVFEELATDAGFTEKSLSKTCYNPDISVKEKLGSSSRYGYKYGDAHLWKPLSSVQYFLDSKAADLGLLPGPAYRQWLDVASQIEKTP